ncbi:AlpA family phage regulatory protein [Xanthomonas campestris pv. campestris]|uniref:helix-turn-helix transcriptional regulator n=1 Tax=Xanthomonas campestris TaxID=339 RepID=UPI002AD4B1D3|nr:AlpA family phage regulatory protein [Xanthomonas campestris]MEA0709484.1 AlpA family phage regulatory protein [Xanthomonas campestris pv. campestris]MEA0742663.1 AlpA family phage regulatory protein [Xanthomonas campestris pv. campestris]
MQQHDLITGRQAARICGFSRSHLGRLAAAGDFPAPIRFSERIVLWERSEVQAWADWRQTAAAESVDDEEIGA